MNGFAHTDRVGAEVRSRCQMLAASEGNGPLKESNLALADRAATVPESQSEVVRSSQESESFRGALLALFAYLRFLARELRDCFTHCNTTTLGLAGLVCGEAISLLAHSNGQRDQTRDPNIRLRLHQFKRFVRATSESWTNVERELVWAELKELADQLENINRSAAVCPQSLATVVSCA